jgi:hypothetical protein
VRPAIEKARAAILLGVVCRTVAGLVGRPAPAVAFVANTRAGPSRSKATSIGGMAVLQRDALRTLGFVPNRRRLEV